jgi:hypothetical protein
MCIQRGVCIHSTKHYQPWTPDVFQDFSELPDPAPLTERQAVLSLLFALKDTLPAPQPSLTALPPLGSSTLAAVQQRAAAAVAAAAAATDALDVSSSWRLYSSEHADLAVQQQQQQQQENHAAVRLERLADHLQAQQKAAAAGTWLSTAAAATQLLEQMPLDAAAFNPCNDGRGSGNDTSAASNGTASSSVAMQPLVDCLAQQLQLASQPHLLMPLGLQANASASDAAGRSSNDQGCRKAHSSSSDGRKGGDNKDQGVTQAAVDAAAAVEAAAALQSSVLPLMRLSAAELGSGAAHMMPGQQQQRDAIWTARTTAKACKGLPATKSSSSSRKVMAPCSSGVAVAASAPPSAAAVRSAAEEELVATSCLAVQGVWSAVDQLWSMAVGDPAASSSNRCAYTISPTWGFWWKRRNILQRPHAEAACLPLLLFFCLTRSLFPCRLVGLTRAAAQQQLLAQVLHVAELRLRLQAFLQHFTGRGAATLSSSSSSSSSVVHLASIMAADEAAAGGGTGDDISSHSVLQAFLSAVKEVLDMHDAAMQMLLYQQQQRRSTQLAAAAGGSAAARSVVPPAMTLLQLVAQLRSMREQLQQLAQCCWCNPCIAADGTAQDLQNLGLSATASLEGSITSSSSGSSSRISGVCSTTTERLLLLKVNRCNAASSTSDVSASSSAAAGPAAAAAAQARAAAAAARAAALPWPGAAAAAYADSWGWDPSRWQLQRGFMGGKALLERLYEGKFLNVC